MVLSHNPVEILLVEDNLDDVNLALYALKKYRLANHIHVVRDGAEALAFLFGSDEESAPTAHDTPRLVLLDLKLPRVDGLEVLKRIRSHPATQNLPVVVMTSSREEQDAFESHRLGVNSYITKPIDFEQFVEAIRQVGLRWLLVNHMP